MNCPKCRHKMRTTHVYGTSDGGSLKRHTCDCGTVVTSQTLVVNVNPGYGEGAAALAKRVGALPDQSSSKGTRS